jgi:hypothetical protein
MFERVRRLFSDVTSFRHLNREVRGLRQQIQSLESRLSSIGIAAAEAEYERIVAAVCRVDNRRLDCFGAKVLSQNDEDGIIAEIFRRIGLRSRVFVEFGTGDGTENNTVKLLMDGWSGLWIDGCADAHRRQCEVFASWINAGSLRSIRDFLDVTNINTIIKSSGISGEIDLLSIDVDGNDLHLWKAISSICPRVVVIEYNAYFPPPVSWCIPYDSSHQWDGRSAVFGASLESLSILGSSLGYRLVGCNVLGLNAFFVRSDECGDHFTQVTSTQDLFHPRRWWLDVLFQRPSAELLSKSIGGIKG